MISIIILCVVALIFLLGAIICFIVAYKLRDEGEPAVAFFLIGVLMLTFGVGLPLAETVRRADILDGVEPCQKK